VKKGIALPSIQTTSRVALLPARIWTSRKQIT